MIRAQSEPVNIGSGQEIDIKTLTETIAQLIGFSGTIEWDSSKPNGQPRRQLDCMRALKEFGWASSTPLGEGLRRTVAWYIQQNQGVTGF